MVQLTVTSGPVELPAGTRFVGRFDEVAEVLGAVPTSRDRLGRLEDGVVPEDDVARSHWDERGWSSR